MSLIAWYPLNGDTKDYSGNNYHLTVKNTGTITLEESGKIGKCYKRPYIGEKCYLGTNKNINIYGSHSMFAWVNIHGIASTGSANGIITNHNHNSLPTGTGITIKAVNDSTFKISCNTAHEDGSRSYYTHAGSTNMSLNTWYHLGLTYCDSTGILRLYVNGQLDGEFNFKNNKLVFKEDILAIFAWSTGYLTNGEYRPSCSINDVRIYNHEISKKEIKDIYSTKILHYKFNNENDLEDTSGYRNSLNCDKLSEPEWSNDSKLGSGSYYFDNTQLSSNGSYKTFYSNNPVFIPEEGTLMFWYKFPDSQNTQNLYPVGWNGFCTIAKINSNSSMGLNYNTGTSDESVHTSNANTNLFNNEWSLYSITWKNGSHIKLYKNDLLVHQFNDTKNMAYVNSFKQFKIGSALSNSYGGVTGNIDDVRAYATELTLEDITDIYKVRAKIEESGNFYINELIHVDSYNNSDLGGMNNDF